jgi:hypothetical protein
MNSTAPDDVGSQEPSITEKYYSLFRGNKSFYVKHQPPFTEDPDTGKVKGSWVGVANEGKKGSPALPVNIDKYREHLEGGDGIAIEPLCADNKCWLAVIDIDVHGVNYTSLIQRLYRHGLKFAPFVSKSGGLHIYFFFTNAEKGKDAIEAVSRVVEIFGLGRLYCSAKGQSKVEVFPKHAVLQPDSLGSCLFLPYYNIANPTACRQKMLTTEGKLIGIVKAIPAIEGMFTSVTEMNAVLDKLPYGDAPYCVQMLTLTGALAEGDGRNDFIYQAAVYLKKKQKDNFIDELKVINNELAEPQPDRDVEATYRSVMAKQLEYKCKSGPCSEFCDTKLCRKREYGVGKDKGNHFTGFASWGEISRVMAEEPYYIWKVQVEEGGPIKDLRLDGEDDLMNQIVVARACIKCLNKAPMIIKTNDWIAIVNQSLLGIENRNIEIPKSTDTTETSALRRYFVRYLTHTQMQHGLPYLVQLGQVYKNEGFYFFTTEGFKDYLRIQKFATGRLNLREELIRYGCSDGEVKYTVSSGEKTIACWKKAEDAELSNMGEFYDDVLESDKAIVAGNRINKVDDGFDAEPGTGGGEKYGDTKF